MPRYGFKVAGQEHQFEFECSYVYCPDTVGDLLSDLKDGNIKALNEDQDAMEKRLEALDKNLELVIDSRLQKPQAHYINWIKETG